MAKRRARRKSRTYSVVFRGCKLFGTTPCGNSGEEGVIYVNPLKGSLGYISKPKKEVGIVLEPVTKKGLFAKFACSGDTLEVGVGSEKEGAAYSPEKTGGYDADHLAHRAGQHDDIWPHSDV